MLSQHIRQPRLLEALRRFLYNPNDPVSGWKTSLDECPEFKSSVNVHHSAAANFYALSDPSGTGGMRREHIRATSSWFKGPARKDCAFVKDGTSNTLSSPPNVMRILLFLSFEHHGKHYECALVHSYEYSSLTVDEDTGMYVVRPSPDSDTPRFMSVIPLTSIYRAAHLEPVYGTSYVPKHLQPHQSLDAFEFFFVNKFIDHHAFDLLHN